VLAAGVRTSPSLYSHSGMPHVKVCSPSEREIEIKKGEKEKKKQVNSKNGKVPVHIDDQCQVTLQYFKPLYLEPE